MKTPKFVLHGLAPSSLSLRHKHYRPLCSVILRLLRRGVLQHGVDAWNHHHTALGRSDGHAPRARPLCHLVHPSLQLLRTPPHDTQVIREEEVGAGRFPWLPFSELGEDVVDEEGEEDVFMKMENWM